MHSLKSRIALLEGAGALLPPAMIYLGESPEEQQRAQETAAAIKGVVIYVSPLDFAL